MNQQTQSSKTIHQFHLIITLVAIVLTSSHFSRIVHADDTVAVPDLTPSGWQRDTQLLHFGIDRYKSGSGSTNVDLLAFPAIDMSASDFIDIFVRMVQKKEQAKGHVVEIVNDEKIAIDSSKRISGGTGEAVDIATRGIVIRRQNSDLPNISLVARVIHRVDELVQFSLMTLGDPIHTDAELLQADTLRFSADLPLMSLSPKTYDSQGPEAVLRLSIPPLIDIDGAVSRRATQTSKPEASVEMEEKDVKQMPSRNGLAPRFEPLPGPQVELTGEMLGPLPTGYRMDVSTTHYKNTDSSSSTFNLALSGDGQFEKSNFAIAGGLAGTTAGATGMPSVVSAGNKHGSTGSVFGDTNPGGQGARSVSMRKREGLDATKYGTYYISGNTLELAYASGDIEKLSFRTDGFNKLEIDRKLYYVDTVKNWEKRVGEKSTHYRSIDGAYLVEVFNIDYAVSNGKKWMHGYLDRLKGKNSIEQAGEIRYFEGEGKNPKYAVAKVPVVFPGNVTKEFYLRYGSKPSLVTVERFKGAEHDDTMLSFMWSIGV